MHHFCLFIKKTSQVRQTHSWKIWVYENTFSLRARFEVRQYVTNNASNLFGEPLPIAVYEPPLAASNLLGERAIGVLGLQQA